MHFVYIVRCADGTLYTGYARDPERRTEAHNAGRGARYTAGRRPVALVYSESYRSIGQALKREHALKRTTRRQKEALIVRPSTKPPRTPKDQGQPKDEDPGTKDLHLDRNELRSA